MASDHSSCCKSATPSAYFAAADSLTSAGAAASAAEAPAPSPSTTISATGSSSGWSLTEITSPRCSCRSLASPFCSILARILLTSSRNPPTSTSTLFPVSSMRCTVSAILIVSVRSSSTRARSTAFFAELNFPWNTPALMRFVRKHPLFIFSAILRSSPMLLATSSSCPRNTSSISLLLSEVRASRSLKVLACVYAQAFTCSASTNVSLISPYFLATSNRTLATSPTTGTGLVAVRNTWQAEATPAPTSSLGVELHCPIISPGALPELTLARVRNHCDRLDALERSPKLRRPASRR